MSKVNATKILTEQEFNNSPYKNLMSYQDYFAQALKLGSAFTLQRAFAMQNAQENSDDITASVKGWYLEKEAKKDEAEARYYASLDQYSAMKNAEQAALRDLNYVTNMYGEDSSKYNQAMKKYNISTKTLFNADIELSCARDRFNSANTSAFKAYLTSRNTFS